MLEVPSGGPEMFLGLCGASAVRFGDAFSLALGHWGRWELFGKVSKQLDVNKNVSCITR